MRSLILVLLLVSCLAACSESSQSSDTTAINTGAGEAVTAPAQDDSDTDSRSLDNDESLEKIQSGLGINAISQPWKGDLDGMAERRMVRVLTVYGLGRYFFDGTQQRGLTYELFKQFEDYLNDKYQTGLLRIEVVFMPVARDQLLSGLLEGRGDIAAAGLTITPERQKLVSFTQPLTGEINEVLVTGPAAPAIESLQGLSGQKVAVRESSSYYQSLQSLNEKFVAEGKPPVEIQQISELLEDEDLFEMVHAGLLPWMVADDYKAASWTQVFDGLTVRSDLVLRSGGHIGHAFRPDSPQLESALNDFMKTRKAGTLTGNILINRYYRDFDWVGNALDTKALERFRQLASIFKQYGKEYGFEYLLVAAQGFQESRLNQEARSAAGAIGVMQMLPSTAADKNVGIEDISTAEPNIHAGIRYLDFIRDRYFTEPEIDELNRKFFALASYNAGPARIESLRRKARDEGLDPNRWFNQVEIIAAREIGRETVQYVANIYKYYITYTMAMAEELKREEVRQEEGLK